MSDDFDQTGSIIHLPPRPRHFIGRQLLLGDLKSGFQRTDVAPIQGIFGPEAIGKSAAAAEFAWRNQSDYQLIWWLRAGHHETLEADLAALADRLALTMDPGSLDADVGRLVMDELDQRDRWLLIFDDAPTVKSVAHLFPRERRGHVLVTTRTPNGHGVAMMRRIGPLARAESIAYLRAATGRQDSQFAAARIAAAMRDVPGALDLSARLIEQGNVPFADFLARFEALWAELLTSKEHQTDAPIPLQMTFELGYRELEAQDPAAADVLRLCCFFGVQDIRLDFLQKGAPYVLDPLSTTLRDRVILDQCIQRMASLGLVQTTSESLSVSPLRARLRRQRVAEEERVQCVTVALNLTRDLFHFDPYDTTTYNACAGLVHHAIAVAEEALSHKVKVKDAAELLNDLGRYLLRRGRFTQSKETLDRALAVWTEQFGPNHPTNAAIANNLGRAHLKLGEIEQARSALEMALRLDEKHYGTVHPHVAEVLTNYALCLHLAGETNMAQEHLRRALSIAELNPDMDQAKVAAILNNLGYVQLARGELDDARAQLEQALDLARQRHRKPHPDVASILTNLADVLRLQGELAEALEISEEAVRIDQQLLGRSHPDVARDLYHLAHVHLAMGEPGIARTLFERALAIDEETYGPQHHTLVRRLTSLGSALRLLDEREEARRCLARAAAIESGSATSAA